MKKINLIDVGSIGGLPKELNNNKDKIDNILSFEPFEESVINTEKQITYNRALWRKKCKKNLYIYNSPHGSSLFMQNYDYIGMNYFNLIKERGETKQTKNWFQRSLLIEKRELWCETLDNVLSNIPVEFHFLKSDTQGAEWEMLTGSDNFLRKQCLGLQLELYNIPIYKNIKLKDAVTKLLKKYNFKPYKKLSTGGTFASQEEYVFIKDGIKNEYIDIIKGIYK